MLVSTKKQLAGANSWAWAIHWRQPASIAVILICILVLVTTPPSWSLHGLAWQLCDSLGLVLIVIAAFGRLWSSLYISGYKEDKIITQGPYAIVRNPLYVFSFLGAIGLGLVTQHLVVLGLITVIFLLYYPMVVCAEEQLLEQKFGQVYTDYQQEVPRFLPRGVPLVEPDIYPLRPRHVRRSMQQIVWFFWAYLLLKWAAALCAGQEFNRLPLF